VADVEIADLTPNPTPSVEDYIEVQRAGGGAGTSFKTKITEVKDIPRWLFFAKAPASPTTEYAQPYTWTLLQWPVDYGNTTGWTLDADGGTFLIPDTDQARGVWECSATAAWEPKSDDGTDCIIHRRKVRWMSSNDQDGDVPIAEHECVWHPDAVRNEVSTDEAWLNLHQVYGNLYADTAKTGWKLWAEVWHNNDKPLGLGTLQLRGPLGILARACNY
jgi:hypothetical protein